MLKFSFEENLSITINDDLKIKCKKQGEKKPYKEIKIGDDFNRDRGKYIFREQVVDRENNYYIKIRKQARFLRHDEGLLTDHKGFGNAKVSPSKL